HATSFGVGTSSSFLFFSRLLADPADPAHRLYAVGARYQTAAPQYAFVVARLTAFGDGLDPAWGGGAPVVTVVPGVTQARSVRLALQPDGKLVVVGQAGDQFDQTALARYDATGALDPTFGGGGTVVVTTGFAEGISVQDDGALLLAGSFRDGTFSGFGVMRLLPDGSPDPSFGSAGVRVTALAKRYTQGTAVAVTALADGRIAAAGG